MNSSYPTTNGRTCTHHTLQWTLGHALIIHYNGRQDIKSSYTTTDVRTCTHHTLQPTVGHEIIIHYNGRQDKSSSYCSLQRTVGHENIRHYNRRQDMRSSYTTSDGRTSNHHALQRTVGHELRRNHTPHQTLQQTAVYEQLERTLHFERTVGKEYVYLQRTIEKNLLDYKDKNLVNYKGRRTRSYKAQKDVNLFLATNNGEQKPVQLQRMKGHSVATMVGWNKNF